MKILMKNTKQGFRFIETLNTFSYKYLDLKKNASNLVPLKINNNTNNNNRLSLYNNSNNNISSSNFDISDDFCSFM